MTRIRPTAVAVLAGAALLVSACGDDGTTAAPDSTDSTPAKTSTKVVNAAACTTTPTAGEIVRSGYGLNYSSGDMTISVAPVDGPARCLQFAKSGLTDPNVPPDTLLFTFAGDRGEGAQLEFLAVDLAGAILPWPRGATARVPGSPITSTIGVSIDGVYYTSPTCTLKLQTVTAEKASGRFDCPQAIAQTANPLDPNDDITYDDESTVPTAPVQPPTPTDQTKTAALSGLFEVEK